MSPFPIVRTQAIEWIPLSPGICFKPITFFPDDSGYQLLLRVEPGAVVPRHRHTGEIHSLVLSGVRRIAGADEDIDAGCYVYEPVGNEDSWWAVGDAPCIVFIEANGRVEYLDDDGAVVRHTDAGTARREYLQWCADHGVPPVDAFATTRGA